MDHADSMIIPIIVTNSSYPLFLSSFECNIGKARTGTKRAIPNFCYTTRNYKLFEISTSQKGIKVNKRYALRNNKRRDTRASFKHAYPNARYSTGYSNALKT